MEIRSSYGMADAFDFEVSMHRKKTDAWHLRLKKLLRPRPFIGIFV
jgi:hypothetical protein